MCNTQVDLEVATASGWKKQPVDKCIASIVNALNRNGIYTASCCCGHGYELGHIWLQDGRVLVIMQNPTKDEVVGRCSIAAEPAGKEGE